MMTILSDKIMRGVAIMLASSGAWACSSATHADGCARFPSNFARSDISIYKLEQVSVELPPIRKAISRIHECYPHHRYMNLDYKLIIEGAREYKEGTYFVVAELHGADDLRLAFEVDKDGNVLNSYQYSMLHSL
jgi:hypothetical protein